MNTTKTNDSVGLPPAGDRRQHDRIPFRVPVRIISHGVRGDNSADGICTDINQFAVAFETEAELDLNDPVKLVFEMKNKVILRSSARLLYRMGPRYGAYFSSPEEGLFIFKNLAEQPAP